MVMPTAAYQACAQLAGYLSNVRTGRSLGFLELGEVVEALPGGVVGGERLCLRALDREIGSAAQRAERIHQQFVGLQGVQRGAERIGQTASTAGGAFCIGE